MQRLHAGPGRMLEQSVGVEIDFQPAVREDEPFKQSRQPGRSIAGKSETVVESLEGGGRRSDRHGPPVTPSPLVDRASEFWDDLPVEQVIPPAESVDEPLDGLAIYIPWLRRLSSFHLVHSTG